MHGLGKLLDGVALGHEVAQVHFALVYGFGNELKVLVGVHVIGLEVKLVLLMYAVGEGYAVLHERVLGDLAAAVDEGVRQGYTEGYLRKSVVRDPLDRVNTGDNTPAFLYCDIAPGDRLTITVAPKGFGSENMSQIKMLRPSDGLEGVKSFVIQVVEEAGPNPCPPIVVGVGIGGTFDKAAYLAKKALLRPVDQRHADPFYRELEEELLREINKLGIGPQGFGGATTALAVNIERMPTHIAGLPVAVNISCHVTRHKTEVI